MRPPWPQQRHHAAACTVTAAWTANSISITTLCSPARCQAALACAQNASAWSRSHRCTQQSIQGYIVLVRPDTSGLLRKPYSPHSSANHRRAQPATCTHAANPSPPTHSPPRLAKSAGAGAGRGQPSNSRLTPTRPPTTQQPAAAARTRPTRLHTCSCTADHAAGPPCLPPHTPAVCCSGSGCPTQGRRRHLLLLLPDAASRTRLTPWPHTRRSSADPRRHQTHLSLCPHRMHTTYTHTCMRRNSSYATHRTQRPGIPVVPPAALPAALHRWQRCQAASPARAPIGGWPARPPASHYSRASSCRGGC